MKRVVITGSGFVTPFGVGKNIYRDNIFNGKTASKLIKDFDVSAFPTKFFANVPKSDSELEELVENQKTLKTMSRSSKFASIAVAEAINESGIDSNKINPFRFGTSIGSGGLGLNDLDYTNEFVKLLTESERDEKKTYSTIWHKVSKQIHPLTPLNFPIVKI